MAPLLLAAIVLGLGMVFLHAVEYVAPFVYVSPS
jgi:hypothetical protein